MFSTLYQATGFKRALILCKEGRLEEAEAILKSLQDEFLAVCEENEALKTQLNEVADVLNLAEKIQFDGQKYWLAEENERKGPFCQVCYDRDGLLVHLQARDKHWECQNCHGLYMMPRDEAEKQPVKRATPRAKARKAIPLFLEREMG